MVDVSRDDVVAWLIGASSEDLDAVLAVAQQRIEDLLAERERRAVVGARVVIRGVMPDFLNSLEGHVAEIEGDGLVSVTLSPDSTNRLRFVGHPMFKVGNEPQFTIEAVPAGCCHTLDA